MRELTALPKPLAGFKGAVWQQRRKDRVKGRGRKEIGEGRDGGKR